MARQTVSRAAGAARFVLNDRAILEPKKNLHGVQNVSFPK
jgi:hypothetical protein